MTTAGRIVRYLWTFPTSLCGLVLVPLALIGGGGVQRVDGVVEAWGGWLTRVLASPLMPFAPSAMTLGHVVLGRNRGCIESTRCHERVHVEQAERWGPLFLPAYLLASLWALLRGRNPYYDNPFEREAYRRELAVRRSAADRHDLRKARG